MSESSADDAGGGRATVATVVDRPARRCINENIESTLISWRGAFVLTCGAAVSFPI